MPRPWSEKWTYGIVENFLKTATELASEPDNAMIELGHLLMLIKVNGSDLLEASAILNCEYENRK